MRTEAMITPRRGLWGTAALFAALFLYDRIIKPVLDVEIQDFWKDAARPLLSPWLSTRVSAVGAYIEPFWWGVISTLTVLLAFEFLILKFMPKNKTSMQDNIIIQPELDISESVYQDKEIDISKLLQQFTQGNEIFALNKKYFIRCKFVGPGCLMLDGRTNLDGAMVLDHSGHPLEIKRGDSVVGIPVLADCTFSNVTFSKVQLIASDEAYKYLYEEASKIIPRFWPTSDKIVSS